MARKPVPTRLAAPGVFKGLHRSELFFGLLKI
jgi:hypothetical protein